MSLLKRTNNPVTRNSGPLSSADAFQSLVDRFFGDVSFPTLSESDFHVPATDISESKESYCIATELPGIKKEDIKLSLHDGILTIEAETKSETNEEGDNKTLRRERRYGKFLRRFTLGPQANENSVDAKFENGVLTVTIPKAAPPAQPTPKSIPVS